jgi:hypothetical protein
MAQVVFGAKFRPKSYLGVHFSKTFDLLTGAMHVFNAYVRCSLVLAHGSAQSSTVANGNTRDQKVWSKTKIVQPGCTVTQGNWCGFVATAAHELQDAAAEAAEKWASGRVE